MNADPRERLSALVRVPEAAAQVAPAEIPGLLALLAGLQGALLARLVVEPSHNDNSAKREAPAEPERYLTVENAAALYNVPRHYFYRRAKSIPGARRLSRKCLRLEAGALRRYMASRSISRLEAK